MKENLFDVHSEDSPRWLLIRDSFQKAIGSPLLPLSKAVDELINIEVNRTMAVPQTEAKGKLKSRLSQEWDVLQFSFPGIDSILNNVARNAYLDSGNADSYAATLLNDNEGQFRVTFIADSKSVAEADPSQIMAAVIEADGEFDKWIIRPSQAEFQKNISVGIQSMGDIELEILEALGGEHGCIPEQWPHTCPAEPEGWQDLWYHCAAVEWPKQYIVIKTGPGALVLSRDLYEFIMFFITRRGEDIGRLPCKNSPLLARKTDFKPPSIMKNFRFDATNVRALEAAVAATGGTLVSYIDELLKTYLGTVVAKRLIDNPPRIGDAQTSLNNFNTINEPFGFTVVDQIHKVRQSELNVPALIKQHQKMIKLRELKLAETEKRESRALEEAAFNKGMLGEAKEQIKSIESNYKKMVAKMRAAQDEAYGLRAELDEANDQLQSNLEYVEHEPVRDKEGGIHTAYPTREEVADEAHHDSEAISNRMTRLEKTNAEMMELLKRLGDKAGEPPYGLKVKRKKK